MTSGFGAPTATVPAAGDTTLLSVRDLHVTFPSEAGPVRAVRGLDFDVRQGEVLGIVGESGSGKSVSSLAVLGLLPDRAHVSGSIRLYDRELIGLSDRPMSDIRGRQVAIVFQDPMSALTPVYTVGAQVAEAVRAHDRTITKAAAAARAVDLLDLVGIPNPKAAARAFPHEFSGGMRQRVVIAIAIANDPDLIIADEPTTALDVTVQAQVLDVLSTAREVTGAGIILITHDLGVVAGFADRLMVMYAGRAVEHARPAGGDSPARPGGQTAGPDPGTAAVAGRPATGLPVRAALPDGHRRVPRRRTAAGRDRRGTGGRVHPGRRARRVRVHCRRSGPCLRP
jgi:peptide/nickel transport system ATP-binding protein